jgi:hypothetical protein
VLELIIAPPFGPLIAAPSGPLLVKRVLELVIAPPYGPLLVTVPCWRRRRAASSYDVAGRYVEYCQGLKVLV